MVTGTKDFEGRIFDLFDELGVSSDSFELIRILISAFSLIVGVTIGVLVIVWLE